MKQIEYTKPFYFRYWLNDITPRPIPERFLIFHFDHFFSVHLFKNWTNQSFFGSTFFQKTSIILPFGIG